MLKTLVSAAALLCVAMFTNTGAAWADDCASRGTLDERYCDADGDLLADVPANKDDWKDPSSLIFSYTPVEDPSVYENVFEELMAHVEKVTGKRVRWFAAESYAAQVEAMRSGRLHIAGVSSGAVPYAVNLAGFRPQVAMEKKDGTIGYTLELIVPADSTIKTVADLKGKRVAHVSPSSNSGDTAPRVLFKEMGVEPGKDYEVLYSGKHYNSIMGVANKDYDAAPIASNVLDRMIERGMLKEGDVRAIYESKPFPRTAFGVAHDLDPELQKKIQEAFLSFDFLHSKLAAEFQDEKGFVPVDYKTGWTDVRTIQKETGATYTQEGLSKLGRE